jgi:hypothetical protein
LQRQRKAVDEVQPSPSVRATVPTTMRRAAAPMMRLKSSSSSAPEPADRLAAIARVYVRFAGTHRPRSRSTTSS